MTPDLPLLIVPAADICLVQMPYAAVERPSLGLSLLQSVLRRAGMRAACVYANLAFAERVELGRYRLVDATPPEELVGEWTFAEAAFGAETPVDPGWFERLSLDITQYVQVSRARAIAEIAHLRAAATAFVDALADAIVATAPRVVGCTSVFQQHCASLALLRRVRERAPHIITMVGGANCDGEMGLATHQSFPWVDFVVSGEAEEIAAPLLSAIFRHGRDVPASVLASGVYGPASRERPPAASRATVWNLGAVPQPTFDDYFAALDGGALGDRIEPALPLEASRGCWWGQKHHCTFCGLNGGGMKYRSKDPRVVEAELADLAARHDVSRFIIVDNILDNGYFSSLLPALAARGGPWSLFFETKSNLRRGHVERLEEAGVRWILPGIESLHDEVLRLMDKGSTALGNVALLKWLREKGIRASWNFLVAFPGERDGWYADMAEWLPSIEHLQPPSQAVTVRYDRFSPFQTRPGDFGIDMRRGRSYASVYPVPPLRLDQMAFYFEDGPDALPAGRDEADRPGLRAVRGYLRAWNERFWRPLPPLCSVCDDGETLHVLDTRSCATERRSSFQGIARRVYLACDGPVSRRSLLEAVEGATWDDIEGAVETFVSKRLMLARDGRFLALAVSGDLPALPRHHEFPGGCADVAPSGAKVQPRRRVSGSA